MTNAKRFNSDKVDLTMIPPDAQEEEARVWMMGEAKYGRYNWTKLWGEDTISVVMGSLMRHSLAVIKGERRDPESGLQHMAHVRCNAAMLIRYFNELEASNERNKE